VLTARATMAEFFASRQIDGFVAKPCAPDDLLNEVNRIIFLRAGEAKAISPALAPAEAGRIRRVLLAEDDVALNSLLHTELQRAGFQVEAVRSGPAALELAIMSKPNVLVMRLEMPDMDAAEVAATLQRLPTTNSMAIVVYGIAEPDVPIESVAKLDLDKVTAIKDCAVDKIVNAVAAAATRQQAV